MVAVIPLSDASRRPTRFPWVTLAIIALNVLVFILELSRGEGFVTHWAVIPADIASGHHLPTLLTAMFLHGGWLHIISNMIFLWAFGPEIEDMMRPGRYLAFYLLGGLAAMLAQVAATPASTVPALGASGAIAAIMGAFLSERSLTSQLVGWRTRLMSVVSSSALSLRASSRRGCDSRTKLTSWYE